MEIYYFLSFVTTVEQNLLVKQAPFRCHKGRSVCQAQLLDNSQWVNKKGKDNYKLLK